MTRFYPINKGFTLIELLVVIAVVGVLAGAVIAIINPTAMIQRAQTAKGKIFQDQLTQGPLGYYEVGAWNFNDATNSGLDTSGNNNNGTLNGGVSYVANCDLGLRGCMSFDGVDGYVEIPITASTSLPGTSGESFFLWVKHNASDNIVLEGQNWSRRLFGTQWTIIDINNAYHYLSVAGSNNNQWHHLGYTYNSTTGELKSYVDGVLKETESSANLRPAGLYWRLGRVCAGASCALYYNGQIDEVYIFNQSLSQAMIQKYYAAGRALHMLAFSY